MYQALHTTVVCEGGTHLEVQIKTFEHHETAEYGVAAHWRYKEGKTKDLQFEEKMSGLRQLLEWQRDVTSTTEFIESVKEDIFRDQVFVYSPKGRIIELTAGSTPIDYAYKIHTELGHRCVGAKVNGKLVSLQSELQNGDTVEIMTSKTMRGPSRDWLNANLGYLKTASAREKVRQWFNRQARKTNILQGKEVFHKQLRRLDSTLEVADVARVMNYATADEFFEALGAGTISTVQVVNSLPSQEVAPEPEVVQALPGAGPVTGIEVLGVGDLLTRMAPCCNPISGDDIMGYITRNRGVTVHREECPNIVNEQEKERLVKVTWGEAQTLYPVRITIEAWDRVGLLRDVTALVSEERVNIASCVSEEADDISVISLTVYTDGTDQLSRLISKLEGVEGVIRLYRANSLSPAAASR
jgi:GTP pyrophosphokinase